MSCDLERFAQAARDATARQDDQWRRDAHTVLTILAAATPHGVELPLEDVTVACHDGQPELVRINNEDGTVSWNIGSSSTTTVFTLPLDLLAQLWRVTDRAVLDFLLKLLTDEWESEDCCVPDGACGVPDGASGIPDAASGEYADYSEPLPLTEYQFRWHSLPEVSIRLAFVSEGVPVSLALVPKGDSATLEFGSPGAPVAMVMFPASLGFLFVADLCRVAAAAAGAETVPAV